VKRSTSVRLVEYEGRPVKVTRRRPRSKSLEVALLYRVRNLGRAMDEAMNEFTGSWEGARKPELMLRVYEAQEKQERARAARRCASKLAIRRSRHRLSLLELRHGVDAYTVRDAVELAHQLSSEDSTPFVEQALTITPVEEGRVCSRPPDEFTVDEVGANAPPVAVCHNSSNYRRSPR